MNAVDALPLVSKPSRTARFYEPEVDVLRFFAFLSVFCFHSVPDNYTSLVPRVGTAIPAFLLSIRDALSFGVCMFFLLSSYLITKLLILERENTGSVHMKSFYVRRILRIWPLYLGFLGVMWMLGPSHFFHSIEGSRLLAFLFFAGNIYTGLRGYTANPISPLWTISIEEQFYILWPALARGGTALIRTAACFIVGLSIVSIAVVHAYAANVSLAIWTSSLVQFQFFALGALLAMRFSHRLPVYSAAVRLGLAVAGLALVLTATGPLHAGGHFWVPTPLFTMGYELMAVGIVFLFLSVLGAARGERSRVPAALTYLGKISYGLYVYHELSIQICGEVSRRYHFFTGFRFVSAACLTLLLAMLSYRFFEKPFLILKDRFSLVHTRPV